MKKMNPLDQTSFYLEIVALHEKVSDAHNPASYAFWVVGGKNSELDDGWLEAHDESVQRNFHRYCEGLMSRLIPDSNLSHRICKLMIELETTKRVFYKEDARLKALNLLSSAREYLEHIAVATKIRKNLEEFRKTKDPLLQELRKLLYQYDINTLVGLLDDTISSLEILAQTQLTGAQFTLNPDSVPQPVGQRSK